MWDYRAKCLRVIDGDTLVLLIDQGLSSRQQESIRLLDVSSPELRDLGGLETRKFLMDWLDHWNLTLLEWPLYIITSKTSTVEPEEKRTFTRYLGKIWDINKKSCLNEEINAFLAGHPEWGRGM